MKTRRLQLFPFLLVCLVVLGVVSISSYCTSPFYSEPSAGDSAVFMLIGKYWSEGFLPYVSLWDLKGPIIFLINALGNFKIFGISGLFIIQLIVLLLSAWLMYQWMNKETGHPVLSSLAVCTIMVSMFMTYNGGNNVEEYLTPLLVVAFYVMFKWTIFDQQGRYTHPAKYAFIYGLVFAFSLWSRLTNAIGVGMAIMFISIYLMYRGLWKNLFANIVAFVVGLALLSLPIIAYFYFNGILDEMWYGTFVYNLDYASNSSSPLSSFRDLAGIVGKFGNVIFLLATAILMLVCSRQRKRYSILWIMVSVGTLFWLIRGNGYGHYAIIALPYPCIAFIELYLLYQERHTLLFKKLVFAVSTLFTLLVLSGVLHGVKLINLYKNNGNLATFKEVIKQLPSDYKSSFLAYNCPPDLYLYLDIMPACRFFTMQDWEMQCSATLEPKMKEALETTKPQWIVLGGTGSPLIQDFLQTYYETYGNSVDKYKIYHLQSNKVVAPTN